MKLLPKLLELGSVQLRKGMAPDNLEDMNIPFQSLINMRPIYNGIQPIGGLFATVDTISADVNDYYLMDGWAYSLTTSAYFGLVGLVDVSAHTILVYALSSTGLFTLTNTTKSFLAVEHGSGIINQVSTVNWGEWRAMCCGAAINGAPGEGVLLAKYPAATYAAIVGAGIPRMMHLHSPHVLGFNYPGSPDKFAWCTADDIETWTATATNSAGDLNIREFAGVGIVCVAALGDSIAAYSYEGMAIISYIGAPLYYGYKMAFTHNLGAVSQKAVVSVGNYNYGLSSRGFFKTDGVQYSWIGKESIWETQSFSILAANTSKIFAVHIESKNEIWWSSLSDSSTLNTTFVYNYVLDSWYYSDMSGNSCIPETGNFPAVQAYAGRIYQKEIGSVIRFASTTTNYTSTALLKATDFGDSSQLKYVQAVNLEQADTGGNTVPYTISAYFYKNYSSINEIVLKNSDSKIYYALSSARYCKLRFFDSSSIKRPTIQSITFHGKITGGGV